MIVLKVSARRNARKIFVRLLVICGHVTSIIFVKWEDINLICDYSQRKNSYSQVIFKAKNIRNKHEGCAMT